VRLVTVNIAVELCCFLVALLCLRKERGFWRLIIWFMFYTFGTELLARNLTMHHSGNQWLYNIYLLFESATIGYGFWLFSSRFNGNKSLFFISAALFVIVFLYESITGGLLRFHSLSNSILSVSMVIFSFRYYSLLLGEKGYFNLKKMPEFWWVSGSLFYYFGSTSCNLFFELLSHQNSAFFKFPVRYYIFNVIIIILYSCWSYAFICRYKQRKLSIS
jgi:hypothetical protein